MIEHRIGSDPSAPFLLKYQLTVSDVQRYCLYTRTGKCWEYCRRRKLSLIGISLLSLLLIWICFRGRGMAAGALALGTTSTVLVFLFWSRQAGLDRQFCHFAQQMGLPRELRLVASSEVGCVYSWRDVSEIGRVDGLTAIKFRHIRAALLLPDRIFLSREFQRDFEKSARNWWHLLT